MIGFRQFLQEVSLARVWQHVVNKDVAIGIITAFRGIYSIEDNVARNRKLAAQIRENGYGYVFVEGKYIEEAGTPNERAVKEDSIFIIGSSKDSGRLKHLLIKWMETCEQESALYKPENSEEAVLLKANGLMQSVGEFHPNKIGSYMTKLKNRPGTFVFEMALEQKNWMSHWAESLDRSRASNSP